MLFRSTEVSSKSDVQKKKKYTEKVEKNQELFSNDSDEKAIQPSTDGSVALYSKQLMCEDTGLSYEEPSPNAFSFNSPYGACPACKGLGSVHQVNMEVVIPDWGKSIKVSLQKNLSYITDLV